jgi:PIN domain nuclease of toxin-antitoxin system
VRITRPYGLSLGDRACLALAIRRKATVYTTDAAWKNLNLGIEVEVIR